MTILALFTAAGLCVPQGPTVEVLSLAPLLTTSTPATLAPWGSLLRRPEAAVDLIAANTESIGADAILAALNPDNSDQPRLSIEDRSLLVVGRPLDVQRTRERLQNLHAVLARSCRVELAAWDATDLETPKAFLDAQQFAAFRQQPHPLWRCAAAGQCGRAIVLDRLRWNDYVRRIEGLVAQKQTITHPVTWAYGEGCHAIVQVHGICGSDDLAVHVQYAVSQRRGVVRTVQTGMPGAADLELPMLETAFGTASGRVPSGGALAITLRGHAISGSSLVLTCRVECAPLSAEACREVGLFPIGALTTPALTQPVAETTADAEPFAAFDDPRTTFGRLSSDRVLELVSVAVDGSETPHQLLGDHVLVGGSREARQRVETLLRGLHEQLVRNATIQHSGMLAGDGSATAPNQSVLHELTAPTLLGRQLLAARLLESTTVNRLDAAIATEASTLDPQVSEVQSGTWLQANVVPFGDALHLDATVRCSQSPAMQARTVMPGGGVLMPLDIATRTLQHHASATSGQPIEHGDGPVVSIEGRGYRTTLTTIVKP